MRVLSRLFRRLFLTALADAHAAGRLRFFGEIAGLCRRETFAAHLSPLRRKNWFVYAKPPFSGPEAVLAYLARYTHRVAIANSRLIALNERGVTFRCKDYRRNGQARYRTMTLATDESDGISAPASASPWCSLRVKESSRPSAAFHDLASGCSDGWGADIRSELLPILISSSRQLVEQYLRLFQIGGVEPLGEPTGHL